MGWLTDWLLPYHGHEQDAPTGGRKRTTSNPMEAVLYAAAHGDTITICTGCDRRAHKCRCLG